MRGDNQGKTGKGHQRTCIKDTWTKPKGGKSKGGKWEWQVCGVDRGKMETTILEQQ